VKNVLTTNVFPNALLIAKRVTKKLAYVLITVQLVKLVLLILSAISAAYPQYRVHHVTPVILKMASVTMNAHHVKIV
jgi:uncharacterized membrane protein YqjE